MSKFFSGNNHAMPNQNYNITNNHTIPHQNNHLANNNSIPHQNHNVLNNNTIALQNNNVANNPKLQEKLLKREAKIKRIKKFSRYLEKNMNNYIKFNMSFDQNRIIKGIFLKIESVNGIKKLIPKERIDPNKRFYLRFFITFYNTKTSQFFGNTYKSPLLNIKFNQTGHFELNEVDPLYVYFLSDSNDTKSGIFCILEILFVEADSELRINSQTCEGWGLLDLQETTVGKMGTPTQVFTGTPRNLMHKSMKNFIPINGASIIYTCNPYQEILNLNYFVPIYTILGYTDIVPGILMRTLPRKPIFNEQIKFTQFFDVFLKNVEIEITPTLEYGILEFSKKYRSQKYDLPPNANLNQIVIKERKLKIGIHNTYTFINSNGIQNSIPLTRRENTLIFKGVSHVDNYFQDEFCAFVFELNYSVSLPIMNNREDHLNLILGYAIAIPNKIGMNNKFKSLNLITGPGTTVYGESLMEALEPRDKHFRLNFILSKNKDSYDKTYKEKEIEELKLQMNDLKKNMQEEYTKQILNEKLKFDREREDMLKRKEIELHEMESRLRESQRSLRAIYDKDDNNQDFDKYDLKNQNFNKITDDFRHHQQNNQMNTYDPNQSQHIPNNLMHSSIADNNHFPNNNNLNLNNNINNNLFTQNINHNKNPFQEDQMNIGDNLIPETPFGEHQNFGDEKNLYALNMNHVHHGQTINNLANPLLPNFTNNLSDTINKNLLLQNNNLNNQNNLSNNRYSNTQIIGNTLTNNTNQNTLTNLNNAHFLHPNTMINMNMDKHTNNEFNTSYEKQFYHTDNIQNLNNYNNHNLQNELNQNTIQNFSGSHYQDHHNSLYSGSNFRNNHIHNNQMNNNLFKENNLHFENPTKDISRREKAELISKGILNMQITEKSLSLLNYTFEKEMNDEKKCNNFMISFLAYKPLAEIKDYKLIPNKIHFKFDFWDFDTFVTKSAVINKPTSDIVPSQTPLVITKEGVSLNAKIEEKEMKVQIDFDPSIDNKLDFKEFINYLLTKNLFIEIYDSEKLYQVGYVKIPLRDFLRQGKLTIFHTKEYDIFDYNFMIKGSLQVLIKSVGYNCSKNFKYNPHYLKMLNTKDKYSNTNKKKKVKTNQIKLDSLSEINKENLAKVIMEKADNKNAFNILNNTHYKDNYNTLQNVHNSPNNNILNNFHHTDNNNMFHNIYNSPNNNVLNNLNNKDNHNILHNNHHTQNLSILHNLNYKDNHNILHNNHNTPNQNILHNLHNSPNHNIIHSLDNTDNQNILHNIHNTIENQAILLKGLKLNLDPDTQKKLRALKYSSKPSSDKNSLQSYLKLNKLEELKNKTLKENEFIKSLTYVNKIKEHSKKDIIQKTILENSKNTITLDLIAGQNHYFNFIIQNMEEIDELVQVVITRQNKQIEGEKYEKNLLKTEVIDKIDNENVVSLVIDPLEWKHYVETNKLFKPDDYNIISPQNFLIMKPRETIPLLLKIRSFDLTLKNTNYIVWIYRKEGQPLYNLYLNIRKVFPILDHSYMYYLPENRFSTVKFPNPFKFDKLKIQKFLDYYHCTDSHVSIQLDSVTNEFYFKYKTNAEYSQSCFYLYIFMDEKKSQLYGTWKFDINSVHSFDVHAQIGSKVVQKLTIEDRNPRNVQFFSTNQDILYLPDKYNKPMVLIANLSNEIRCVINPKQNDTFECLLNCVDIASRELVKSWLFRIMADKPEISHVHKIDCKVNQILNFKYEFANPLNNHMIFNFESNSRLLKIIDTRLPFNGGEKKLLNISIPPQSQVGTAEVLMFVSDIEELYTETILFQLNFK